MFAGRSSALCLGLVACAVAPAHFVDTQAGWRADVGAMLDAIGEPAPRPDELVLRFLWCPSFDDVDDILITVARDGDVAYLRYRRRDRDSREWGPPFLVFLDDPVRVRLLAEARWGERDWRLPGIVADGASWYFEGADGKVAWSAYRHSPQSDSPWRRIGELLVDLAQCEDLSPDQLY